MLPDTAVAALREHRRHQDHERADAGERWAGFVFTNRRGQPLSPYSLTKQWHDVCTRTGVPTPRFPDLRHAGVSLPLALGGPPHVVREIAGHSEIGSR